MIMTRTVIVQAPSVSAGQSAGCRALGEKNSVRQPWLRSGGEDSLYRLSRDKSVIEVKIVPRKPVQVLGIHCDID
jgi:hypothetical protein